MANWEANHKKIHVGTCSSLVPTFLKAKSMYNKDCHEVQTRINIVQNKDYYLFYHFNFLFLFQIKKVSLIIISAFPSCRSRCCLLRHDLNTLIQVYILIPQSGDFFLPCMTTILSFYLCAVFSCTIDSTLTFVIMSSLIQSQRSNDLHGEY